MEIILFLILALQTEKKTTPELPFTWITSTSLNLKTQPILPKRCLYFYTYQDWNQNNWERMSWCSEQKEKGKRILTGPVLECSGRGCE